jgi:hypothetical protein
MKKKYQLALRFFTETKNENQMQISYKEIESFLQNYYSYNFYFKFNTSEIPEQVYEKLTEEDK